MNNEEVRFLTVLLLTSVASAGTDWDAMRAQMRQTLQVPDPLPDLKEKLYGRFAPTMDVAADRISYATGYGMRVPAIVYHQAGATITKHPALIIVTGHGGDKSSWYASWAGILYARAGAVVLTYDPINEFERNWQKRSATRPQDTELKPDDMARRLNGLMITDIMQGSRYLAQRQDVDPKDIAVVGFSKGSLISALACAIDTSVKACVLVGGGDLAEVSVFALNAKRGPMLVYGGADLAKLHEQTVAMLGNKKDVFEYQFVEGGHFPYFLTKPVVLWLNEKLKFPNWTKKQIMSMAESPVPEGQGGSLILGTNIPAVPRADLRAIPDVLWDAEQDNYVYESWRDKAKAAAQ